MAYQQPRFERPTALPSQGSPSTIHSDLTTRTPSPPQHRHFDSDAVNTPLVQLPPNPNPNANQNFQRGATQLKRGRTLMQRVVDLTVLDDAPTFFADALGSTSAYYEEPPLPTRAPRQPRSHRNFSADRQAALAPLRPAAASPNLPYQHKRDYSSGGSPGSSPWQSTATLNAPEGEDDFGSNHWKSYAEKPVALASLRSLAPFDSTQSLVPPKPELKQVDTGWDAWSVVVGCFFALFVQFGLGNSFGTFLQYYQTNQLSGQSPGNIAWIGSVQLFLIFFLGSVCGRIFDTYGPRYLLASGCFLLVLSLFLISVFQKYYQLMLIQGVLFGIGMALIYNPCVAVVGQWFVKRRAAAAGIVVAGAGLGGVIFPIMFSQLFPIIGFGWTVRAVAFMCMALLSISMFTVKARLPPRKAPAWSAPVKALKTDRAYAWLVAGAFFGFWGLWGPYFLIGPFASSRGFSLTLAFFMLPIMNAGSIIGRLVGFVADKLGRFNTLISAGIFTSIVTLIGWNTANTRGGVFVFAIFYGAGSGAFLSLFPPCQAQLSPPELMGSRLGLLWFVMSFATLTGPPIAAALVRGTNYHGPAVFGGMMILLGTGCIIMARRTISKEIWKVS